MDSLFVLIELLKQQLTLYPYINSPTHSINSTIKEPNSSTLSKQINPSLIIIFLIILSLFNPLALFLFLLLLQLLLLWRLWFLLLLLFFLLLLLLLIIIFLIFLIVILTIWWIRRNVVPVFEVLLQINWWVLAWWLSCVINKKYHRLLFNRLLSRRSLLPHTNHRPTLVVSVPSFLIRLFPFFDLNIFIH